MLHLSTEIIVLTYSDLLKIFDAIHRRVLGGKQVRV